jgi:hypothetical protein
VEVLVERVADLVELEEVLNVVVERVVEEVDAEVVERLDVLVDVLDAETATTLAPQIPPFWFGAPTLLFK